MNFWLITFVLAAGLFGQAVAGAAAETNVSNAPLPVAKAFQSKLDPVYLIDIDKHPKFEAAIELKNGKRIRFASVKSMMNFYYHPEKYPGYGVSPDGHQIDKLYVRDYLDGKELPAKQAWYVFGSRLVGPHGDDLIPLASKTRAELFVKRFGGTRILSYDELRKKGYGLIKYLDM
ncbi:nitrous oxide reductase accessory protein NosL [Nitratifractor sp.]